jgi:hypothetical protein
VVTREGIPLGYEVFAGNRTDVARGVNRTILVTARQEIMSRPGEPPIGAQDAEQLRYSSTLRSFAPFPWRTSMTPRALSMSSILSSATSESPSEDFIKDCIAFVA